MMMMVVMMHHGKLLLDGGRAGLPLCQLLRRRMQRQRLHPLVVPPGVRHVRLPGLREALAVSASAISTINSGRRSVQGIVQLPHLGKVLECALYYGFLGALYYPDVPLLIHQVRPPLESRVKGLLLRVSPS